MPLAFNSISHGTVAFGFFHIETQMLLLDGLFFWAWDFCALLRRLDAENGPCQGELPAWRLDRRQMGDLHGAIAGVDHSGFIGELYRRRPFPARQEEFKQKPLQGFDPAEVEEAIDGFGRGFAAPWLADPGQDRFILDGMAFNRQGLCQLAAYVWLGGMPRWQGDLGPDYVLETGRLINQSASVWWDGCVLP